MARFEYPNIEAERIKHRMSIDELALQLNVNARTIRRWQTGVTEIPVSKIITLTGIFGVSSDYLLGLEEAKA